MLFGKKKYEPPIQNEFLSIEAAFDEANEKIKQALELRKSEAKSRFKAHDNHAMGDIARISEATAEKSDHMVQEAREGLANKIIEIIKGLKKSKNNPKSPV